MNTTTTLPSAFIWRRLHSLTGLWFTLFLIEHLFVNSQAALMLGDNGRGFVELVKAIHNLPYLQVIEITLLGIPILVHMIWGVKYLFTAKFNSFKTAPNKPSLPEYGRNKAYTWQRITSWILLVALTFHVVKFRFVDYPLSAPLGASTSYFVRLSVDDGLYTVADRLKVTLYDGYEVEKEKEKLQERSSEQTIVDAARILHQESNPFTQAMHPKPYDAQKAIILSSFFAPSMASIGPRCMESLFRTAWLWPVRVLESAVSDGL